MSKNIYIAVLLAFFVSGCVKLSYTSLEDVPVKARPVYDVTHAYMSCAGVQYFELLSQSPPSSGEEQQAALTKLAEKGVDKCGAELDHFKAYLVEKGISKEDADKQAGILVNRTVKSLVSITMDTVSEINKL